ncbi:MAG TPA: hypothetical protein VLX59_07290, partial [Acidimicrobiales bacterium]|nr:hypothetical protein [Acidimicrobiales bacterium]
SNPNPNGVALKETPGTHVAVKRWPFGAAEYRVAADLASGSAGYHGLNDKGGQRSQDKHD